MTEIPAFSHALHMLRQKKKIYKFFNTFYRMICDEFIKKHKNSPSSNIYILKE